MFLGGEWMLMERMKRTRTEMKLKWKLGDVPMRWRMRNVDEVSIMLISLVFAVELEWLGFGILLSTNILRMNELHGTRTFSFEASNHMREERHMVQA
jgi:hypothetical protein